MNKVVKKVVYVIIIIIFSCIGYAIGINIERRHKETLENQRTCISTVAVVNMDESVSLGEERTNYASQLINFPNDHFVMTGLNDEERKYKNGRLAEVKKADGSLMKYAYDGNQIDDGEQTMHMTGEEI